MTPAICWSLAGLPAALWCVSYKSVSLLQVGTGLLLIWRTAYAVTAIGLLAAALGGAIGQCWRRVTLFATVFALIPLAVPSLLANTVPQPWRLLPLLSPLAAAFKLCGNRELLACGANCAVLLAFGTVWLAVGARVLRRTAQQHGQPTSGQRLRLRLSLAMKPG